MLKVIKNNSAFIAILVIGAFFRLSKLGYSNFLQDEVGAQNFLFDHQSFLNFLLSRSIGPGEFIISKIFNFFFFDYHPEFYVRLPFAIAGILIVISTYSISLKLFDKQTALVTSGLFSLSGLFIAFSRIVQYQSFLILFVLWSFYFVIKNKPITAGIITGVALLLHYDTLSFLIPALLYYVALKDYKNLFRFLLPTLAISALFYLPYVLQNYIDNTLNYILFDRISSNFRYDSVYHSVRLLNIFHPIEFLFVLFIYFISAQIKYFKNRFILALFIAAYVFVIVRGIFIEDQLQFLKYVNTLLFVFLLYKLFSNYKNTNKPDYFLILWLSFSVMTYLVFFSKPLTHIYTILIPAFIIIGKSKQNFFVVSVVVLSLCSFNYNAFVETDTKYPWQNEKYIFGNMKTEYTEKISESLGIGFGFPYNRDWKNIKKSTSGFNSYDTNERYRITKYYLQHLKYIQDKPEIYIHIFYPYSLENAEKYSGEILEETENYKIIKVAK